MFVLLSSVVASETQFDAVTTKSVLIFEKEEEAENNRKKALRLLCFCCPFDILISTSTVLLLSV